MRLLRELNQIIWVFLIIHGALNGSYKLTNYGPHPGCSHFVFAQCYKKIVSQYLKIRQFYIKMQVSGFSWEKKNSDLATLRPTVLQSAGVNYPILENMHSAWPQSPPLSISLILESRISCLFIRDTMFYPIVDRNLEITIHLIFINNSKQ